jgi:hypothetical protein
MHSLDSSMSCQGCENCPTCGQLADRHLATSRAKTAREVAKDFLTLVTDRDRLRGGIKIAACPAGS